MPSESPDLLAPRGIVHLRADNPSPLTLEGTNTWIVPHEPGATDRGAWVVDPGPDLGAHLDAVVAAADRLGGLRGVALTHRHHDHADGVPGLLARAGLAPVVSHLGTVPEGAPDDTPIIALGDGEAIGPFVAHATPGHAADHVAFAVGDVVITGDAVLGRGSVMLVPHPGALAGYLAALERLRALGPALLLPGHGPIVEDPDDRLREYVAHRLDREARLIVALDDGLRTVDELLDRVWDDAPGDLRLGAAVTLESHLGKLADEGRLPADAERRDYSGFDGL